MKKGLKKHDMKLQWNKLVYCKRKMYEELDKMEKMIIDFYGDDEEIIGDNDTIADLLQNNYPEPTYHDLDKNIMAIKKVAGGRNMIKICTKCKRPQQEYKGYVQKYVLTTEGYECMRCLECE